MLDRQFTADAPNQKWVADFTYIWSGEGWLYVAVVLDLFSRRVVGWSMQASMTSQLVADALMMAVWRRGRPVAVRHHSDQGSQYTSGHFQDLLHEQGIQCSMSRAGEVWDNSAMESFFSSTCVARQSSVLQEEPSSGKPHASIFENEAEWHSYSAINKMPNSKHSHLVKGWHTCSVLRSNESTDRVNESHQNFKENCMKPITLRRHSIRLFFSVRKGALGVGMAASVALTNAAILDLGDHPSNYLFQASVVSPGEFEDIFTFSVTSGFGLLGSVVASIDGAPSFEIAGGRYFVVFAGSDWVLGTGDDILLSPPTGFEFDDTTGATFNPTPSGSGIYGLVARGTATGTSGGRYSFTSFIGATSPVPEPKGFALALGGLPLIGWLAHRRARSLPKCSEVFRYPRRSG